jgi:hypothetical protein
MSPETKLKTAAEEIKEVLRKHDLAGAIAIQTPGVGEHFVHFNTSYSCAYVLEDNEVRVICNPENFANPEERIEKLTHTANMLKILQEATAYNYSCVKQILDTISNKVEVIHTKPKHK